MIVTTTEPYGVFHVRSGALVRCIQYDDDLPDFLIGDPTYWYQSKGIIYLENRPLEIKDSLGTSHRFGIVRSVGGIPIPKEQGEI